MSYLARGPAFRLGSGVHFTVLSREKAALPGTLMWELGDSTELCPRPQTLGWAAWIWVPALPLGSWVTLGEGLTSLSLVSLRNADNNSIYLRGP